MISPIQSCLMTDLHALAYLGDSSHRNVDKFGGVAGGIVAGMIHTLVGHTAQRPPHAWQMNESFCFASSGTRLKNCMAN